MRWSPKIVTIAGIPIRVNWTFAGLLVLVVAATAGSGAGAVGAALLWLLLLFASVVVHELAHSLLARHRGLRVRDIVLLPIGGMSEIEDIGRTAGDELRVAAVGPATSLALAGVLAAAGAAAGHPPWPPALTTGPLEDQMAWVNLVLGVFNLLPALPMDGGRVLRAALTPRYGTDRATAVATRLATALGALMVVGGVLYDLWVALIGVFVIIGARGEEQSARLQAALGSRRVGDLVVSGALVLPEATTVSQAAVANQAHPWWAVTVVDGAGYVGLVSADRLGSAPPDATLGHVADRRAPMLVETDLLYPTAIEAFVRSRQRQLAVGAAGAGGRVVGLLELDDVEWLVRRLTVGSGRR